MNIDIKKVHQVVTALRAAHPYEEPAIDIVPLLDEKDFNLWKTIAKKL